MKKNGVGPGLSGAERGFVEQERRNALNNRAQVLFGVLLDVLMDECPLAMLAEEDEVLKLAMRLAAREREVEV